MYCIAQGCVLPPLTDEQRYDLLKRASLCSLAQTLEAVPDPRGRHGLRYDLPFLLSDCSSLMYLQKESSTLKVQATRCDKGREHVQSRAMTFQSTSLSK